MARSNSATTRALSGLDSALEGDCLGRREFEQLAAHIRSVCGIQMPPSKHEMLQGRLRRRVRALGLESLDAYAHWLFAEGHLAEETPHLINAVTTNKTDFFREPVHFDFLASELLPAFAKAGRRTLRVWSAACSTGAEPYTLAMVLDDFANRNDGPGFGILATDIDTNVLETARRGIYPRGELDPVPAAMRKAYVLEPRDSKRDEVRIAAELRSAVGFARLNLMDSAYPVGQPMDLIFCRNVLIYFDKATQVRVVQRLVDNLRPGGCLFLGHSESAHGVDPRLTCIASTIYQRHSDGGN